MLGVVWQLARQRPRRSSVGDDRTHNVSRLFIHYLHDTKTRTAVTAEQPVLAVFWILKVEAGASIPFGTLVAVCRNAAGVFEHLGEVHQVPGHKRGVAVGEVVLGAARTGVQIAGARADFAYPAGV